MHKENQIIKRVPWVFFDLDDTLWNFSFNSLESLHFIYYEFPVIKEIFPEEEDFVSVYHKNNAFLWDEFSHSKISSAELRPKRWLMTLFPQGFSEEDKELCKEIDDAYLLRLGQLPNIMEGANLALEKLTKYALIAILSNGFQKVQYAKAMNSGLWKYITRLIVSDEITVNKPHPNIFKYAIEETGAENPVIMVGDNLYSDVLGALKSGWFAIWFNPEEKDRKEALKFLSDEGADIKNLIGISSSLIEVENIIHKFLSERF